MQVISDLPARYLGIILLLILPRIADAKPTAEEIVKLRDRAFARMSEVGHVNKSVIAEISNENQVLAIELITAANTSTAWDFAMIVDGLRSLGGDLGKGTHVEIRNRTLDAYYKIALSVETEEGVQFIKRIKGPNYNNGAGNRRVQKAIYDLTAIPAFFQVVRKINPLQIRAIMLAIDDPSVKLSAEFFMKLKSVNTIPKYSKFASDFGVYGTGCSELFVSL